MRSLALPISLLEAFGMWIRRTPVGPMRRAWTQVERAGLPVTLNELEAHSLACGNVERVVEAMLAARAGGLQDDFRLLSAVDLAGKDPLMAVRHKYDLRAIGLVNSPGHG
jgi:uncharacterized protein YqfA (UPF0365 family)